ncbi:response regulator [candidate division KSB1 bacterium]|nr:response regulator [bacterium]OQX59367.1 MAG: two-component system response regulator [candidate division KSB1 bacterium 4484_219]RKY74502.1 MAG: response regulator [candidate division KSB1 bacterium]HDI51554.1 response regulator [Bacteroidota bacterium]RKY78422.1 MAG: response regulator [candidate division KSB1 bacterium]
METILVVEDEESLRLLYERELTREGYRVISAESGEEAVQKINGDSVDLIVLDIRLTGMNGLEALEEMLLKKRNLKVVINTAYANYKDDFSSWLADAYLIKSSDLDELKSTIRNLLHKQ